MKRKSLIGSIAVVLFLLVVYIIWHYSPLRYLTQSGTGSGQTVTDADENRNRPVIVTKKILPEPKSSQQTEDLPRPVIVTKKILPEPESSQQTVDLPRPLVVLKKIKPEPVQPQVEIEIPAAAEKKTAPLTPAESSSAKMALKQPAAAEKPAESPPQPSAKKIAALAADSYHPYSIMLSSCRLPQSARKVVSDYTKAGLAPYVVKVKFESGDEWLRVLTGHYQTRREAIQAKNEHRLASAIVKRTPYTNLIGTYASLDEMQADLQQIKQLGYSPYFLKTPAGQLKLLVGAFVSKERAQDQQAELQTKGIQSTVAIR